MSIVDVLLPIPLDSTFYYLCSSDLKLSIGEYVKVPFGRRIIVGIVVNLKSEDFLTSIELKNIIDKVSLTPVRKELINYLRWVSQYNIIPLGSLLKMSMGNVVNVKSIAKIVDYYCVLENKPYVSKINLSNAQKDAYMEIIRSFSDKSVILLDGQTGSGKTEVYCAVIEMLVKDLNDVQILIILPEIVLAVQLIKRIRSYFESHHCIEWHSSLTIKKRRENWLAIINGKAAIIIGTRSALFLPYKNLKLIIVDEEHEASFKQDQAIIYNARDMAIVLGKKEKIPVILSSATPSLETINNVRRKCYEHVSLTKRFGVAKLPSVKIIDMRSSKLINKWLSEELYLRINNTLNKKNQVMLFLNRRGYAQLKLCKVCGFKINCPNCSTWLVEHKRKRVLLCHYCAYSCEIPSICSNCLSELSLISCGIGIEKLAEEISNLIPQARVALLSSDISSKELNKLITAVLNEEVEIIVGTQIIAKGHNFPKLTLVGIIDADLGLESCDLRATERTYQLLHQVAGRSGRFEENGQVILQTYDSENPILKSVSLYNRDLFYDLELNSRYTANMPPYIRLVAIIIASKIEKKSVAIAQEIVKKLPNDSMKVLGPAPAPISFLNKYYRYRILIKIQGNVLIQTFLKKILQQYKSDKQVKIIVDIDPINFM